METKPMAFATEPVRVRLSKGTTLNTGNYTSARVDIAIDIPCAQNKMLDTIKDMSSTIDNLLEQEVAQILWEVKKKSLTPPTK